jgi:hypothetical protein
MSGRIEMPAIVWPKRAGARRTGRKGRGVARAAEDGKVPDWIRRLASELGPPSMDPGEIRRVLGSLKPSLSEEIVSERGGERS